MSKVVKSNSIFDGKKKVSSGGVIGYNIVHEESPLLDVWILNNYLYLLATMTEQQGTPDQLPAEKDQGGAGATYKVHFSLK